MNVRQIEALEIQALERQGCLCENWSLVQVVESFRTDHIHFVQFEGHVRIGLIDGENVNEGGMSRKSQLGFCSIKNCEIRNRVYINNVGLIEGYLIESHVIIQNVDSLITVGPATFGNGVTIEVLNEGGGRSLPIYNELNAQMAYLLVCHRYHSVTITRLEDLINAYCQDLTSNQGVISEHTSITNTTSILNVHFAPYCNITGALCLEDGTLWSTKEAPINIGHGVIAKKFIVQSGSQIDSGAVLDHCFVGQSVKLGKQFSAENSAFFANCEGFHGEAVSLFAGPYTVTHHKSTLLIASMLSFFNAGSGTNQSNHMYKLGPLHQGIMERGSKTGSFSYLLWPSKIGPYSVVMGKHSSNFDTSEFPFSYITLEHGRSTLTPAMNLFTVGTKRDTQKWPSRDRRPAGEKKDLIHFDLFNPYIVGKMINAIQLLRDLYEKTPRDQKLINYKGVTIPRLMLNTAKKYYLLGLKTYYGEKLIQWLEENALQSIDDIRRGLINAKRAVSDNWVDLAGLITPLSEIEQLHRQIEDGWLKEIRDVNKKLLEMYNNYSKLSLAWFIQTLEKDKSISVNELSLDHVKEWIENWRINGTRLNNMILQDAKKEFDKNSQIGYGLDGDQNAIEVDFASVRGSYEGNAFVQSLTEENQWIDEKARYWINRIEKQSTPISS
jgi:NDP-sugar pyrophosphorylase family protein